LVLILFILIIFKPGVIPLVPTPFLSKHSTLSSFAVLLILQTICALILLRAKKLTDAASNIYQEYSISKSDSVVTTKSPRNLFQLFKRYRFHILLWVIMIVYMAFGPALYAQFVLANGKSVQINQELPAPTKDIQFAFDRLDPIKYSGQDLYHFLGWSFYNNDPDQSMYDRYIVLHSDKKTYFFPTEIFKRIDLQKHFPEVNFDLVYAGYSALVSKDGIRLGEYHLGILFVHKSGEEVYYYESNYMITRTANHLELSTAE
jgi:hypothetical protein